MQNKNIDILIEYMKIIKQYANQGIYINLDRTKNQSISDIIQNVPPLFTFCGVNTWIFRGKNGYSIIWKTTTDWNLAWLEDGCSICKFREYPSYWGN